MVHKRKHLCALFAICFLTLAFPTLVATLLYSRHTYGGRRSPYLVGSSFGRRLLIWLARISEAPRARFHDLVNRRVLIDGVLEVKVAMMLPKKL